jgi:tetratricopeptide (TPR) repeat protein
VTGENREKFRLRYQAGKEAFERGEYRLSIQYLEEAIEAIARSSRLGGEAQMWLVTAYQAAGNSQEAVALCQELAIHPHPEIRKQAKNLLYIIKAPELKRPKEWMTQIPDLSATSEGNSQYVAAKSQTKNSATKSQSTSEPVDLSEVNTQDNQFVWVALILTLLIFAGLIFWG